MSIAFHVNRIETTDNNNNNNNNNNNLFNVDNVGGGRPVLRAKGLNRTDGKDNHVRLRTSSRMIGEDGSKPNLNPNPNPNANPKPKPNTKPNPKKRN